MTQEILLKEIEQQRISTKDILILGGEIIWISQWLSGGILVVQEGGLPFFADAQGDSLLTIKREKPPVPHWLTPMSTQRCPKFSEFFPLLRRSFLIFITRFQLPLVFVHMDSPLLFLLSNMAVTPSTLRKKGHRGIVRHVCPHAPTAAYWEPWVVDFFDHAEILVLYETAAFLIEFLSKPLVSWCVKKNRPEPVDMCVSYPQMIVLYIQGR